MIRKNLSTQGDRLDKLRQDRYDKMEPKGFDKTIFMAMKGLKFEDAGNKKGAAAKRAESAIAREADKDLGIKKRSPAKKGSGSSRGGLINKKTKASFELSGASIAD